MGAAWGGVGRRSGGFRAAWMIKFFFSTPFHCFPTIPILSLPGGPGDVPIVSDQNIVGWYIGLHRLVDRRAHELQQLFNNASCVYVQARRNG